MDIFDKYDSLVARSSAVLGGGANPFGLRMERVVSPTEAVVDGKPMLLVGTNNYLGLTFDPRCIAAGVAAMQEQGTGTTGSRIANGSYALHEELESELGRFMRRRGSIVFSTGYQANLAMICGLAGPQDTILVDADSHASIYDGCRLSGATVIRFRHNDAADLDRRLTRLGDSGGCKLIIVEGLYSMLGDVAPLPEFVEVKRRHGAFLLVDEAHSFGVFGATGRGVAEAQEVEEGVDFIAGTFSKSLGAIGGFGVSDHPKFDYLRYASRPYMFTASPSPATMASVTEAVRRIAEEPEMIRRLWRNAQMLYQGLVDLGFEICAPMGPVIAVRMHDEAAAVAFWNGLIREGVYVNLALPPGTPNRVCLLRCSLSAAHTPDQVQEVIERFARVSQALGAEAVAARD